MGTESSRMSIQNGIPLWLGGLKKGHVPLMFIVPDVQDVYTPLQTDVIVQLSECRQHPDLLLESIPTMFQNNKTFDSAFGAFGAGIKATFFGNEEHRRQTFGISIGKPMNMVSGLFLLEKLKGEHIYVSKRSDVISIFHEPHKLLQPVDKTLKTMAIEFAEYQVSVDVFLTTQSYVNIASISIMYYYHPFYALFDPAKLYNDLRWNVTRPQGIEAVMRVTCSQGLQVQE
ncbi:putative sec23/Sec24, trunk domain, von Willebrand factor A-like domain superfamily [Helianthus anomalus]